MREDVEASERVYCQGPLLESVQSLGLFEDSKTFVDMPMRSDPETILAAFAALPERTEVAVRAFVESHFEEAGSDLEPWVPDDWVETPERLAALAEPWRGWALDLNARWKELGRSSRARPGTTSLLALKHGFVAPGGRFREPYYWDTYWIVLGLLACDMRNTARGVISNLLAYVDDFGHVPNGGRVYYLNRSQPPMLSEMVVAYVDAAREAGDDGVEDFVRDAVPRLEAEYAWWMRERGARGLNRYWTSAATPRPESYREDLATNGSYADLAAAAESGWDFSCRWFRGGADLAATRTTAIIPVDLNAIMLRFERNLAALSSNDAYRVAAEARVEAIQAQLWRPRLHRWTDNTLDGEDEGDPLPYASDFAMLWAGVADDADDREQRAIVETLAESGLIQAGGVLTSRHVTGQQWDAPNAWPPLQFFVAAGLRRLRVSEAQTLASTIETRFLNSAYAAWSTTGDMHEKYDAFHPGQSGGGGEYAPQLGFGWTNGLVLSLLTAAPSNRHDLVCNAAVV